MSEKRLPPERKKRGNRFFYPKNLHNPLILRIFAKQNKGTMTTEETLRLMVETLTKVNDRQSRQIEELSRQVKEMTAQLAWFQRQLFGRRSEKRLALEGQPSLFGEDGLQPSEESPAQENAGAEENTPAEEAGEAAKSRKPAPRRRQTWDSLPVLETRTIEPEGVDLTRYRKIGEETTYTLGYKPGKIYRIATVRPKYGLIDSTEPVERGEGVKIAPMPLLPIPKGMPDASLLAEVLLQKYEYHVPFYRQIKQLAHLGMAGLKEATLTGWFKRTMQLLQPLYKALVAEVFKSGYVQADETTTPVINRDTGQAEKEYLWMARAVMEGLAVFFYDDGSRAGRVIKDKADEHGFKGYLQCDGFGGYTAAFKPGCGVALVACLVHIRRAFERGLEENRQAATWFLVRIRQLYHIEHKCDAAGMDFDQRKAARLLESKPVMDEMKAWLETEGIKYSEGSLMGKAVTYAYTRWAHMERVLEDGRLLLDNNLAENEIRPITLGRKNYLFCGNHEAAGNMCVVTSLLATCRNHDVNPRLYLNSVIESMPYFQDAPSQELVKLLPHRWKEQHPEAVTEKIRDMAK